MAYLRKEGGVAWASLKIYLLGWTSKTLSAVKLFKNLHTTFYVKLATIILLAYLEVGKGSYCVQCNRVHSAQFQPI